MAGQNDSIKMNPSLAIYRGLKRAGIDFATSVPCVNLQELLDLVDIDPETIHVPVTREEESVGLCAPGPGWGADGQRYSCRIRASGTASTPWPRLICFAVFPCL